MEPKIITHSVRTVFDDGAHNAFTDLCRFGDSYYLSFRTCPQGHKVFADSRIVVLRSADAGEWEEVHRFSIPDRDVRDPHFLVFRDTLFVYTGTWLVTSDPKDRELNDHRGYGVWSADGRRWEGPRFLQGTQGYYVWRAAVCGGVGYLNGRRKKDFAVLAPGQRDWEIEESWLLATHDGLSFRPATLVQDSFGDETAFIFERDESIVAVVRNRDSSKPAFLCRARPPYTSWRRTALDRPIGGPLLAPWDGRLLVGGRKTASNGGAVTALSWLVDDRLKEATELPSGGDTSYPGFVPLSPTRGLLSYYSSHEGSRTQRAPCAIYLAEIRLAETSS